MSTVPHEAASLKVSPTNEPLAKLVFDHPGADIILRSHDCYHLRAPKITIVNNSSVLGKIIQNTIDSLGDANAEANLRGRVTRIRRNPSLPSHFRFPGDSTYTIDS